MKPVDKAPGGNGGRGGKRRGPRTSKCPLCGQPTVQAYRPFCSKRCADIDLGRWLEGEYAVPGEPGDPGETSGGEE